MAIRHRAIDDVKRPGVERAAAARDLLARSIGPAVDHNVGTVTRGAKLTAFIPVG
jgi:hypothetical protein